ncbi:MAG: S-layer homology domain-containing protein, partial [Clostridia bacterium]|nr:S-layer homology domain-containing protein [Clostridia bacterium]
IAAMILIVTTVLSLTANAASVPTFEDVPKTEWCCKAVSFVAENGYMKGIDGEHFSPSGELSRAMVVTILAAVDEADMSNYSGDTDFADVPVDSWYAKQVEWANEAGIVSGISDTSFDPNGLVTREQFALMIMKFVEYKGNDVSCRAVIKGYEDYSDISDWAVDAVAWANMIGLINGTSAKTLSPKSVTLRSQAAVMIKNVCEYIKKTGELAQHITVSKAFGNDMVVQHGKTLRVWGFSSSADDEGKTVWASFRGATATGTVKDGKWTVKFDETFDIDTEGATLSVWGADKQYNYYRVLTGDVYLVFGQSNCWFPVYLSIDKDNFNATTAKNPDGSWRDFDYDEWKRMIDTYNDEEPLQIRFMKNSLDDLLDTNNHTYPSTSGEYGTVEVDDIIYSRRWGLSLYEEGYDLDLLYEYGTNDEYVGEYSDYIALFSENPTMRASQLGYMIAQTINMDTGIPVGICQADYSGRPLVTFLPNDLTEELGLDMVDPNNPMVHITLRDMYIERPTSRVGYNFFIKPYENFSVNGLVWYQGESDFSNTLYRLGGTRFADTTFCNLYPVFANYIRSHFGDGDEHFPFYMVEYAPLYRTGGMYISFGIVKSEQSRIANQLDNFYMAASSDAWNNDRYNNNYGNVHPYCKDVNARRVCDLMYSTIYKDIMKYDLEYSSGPQFTSVEYDDMECSATVTFRYVADGLTTTDGESIKGIQVKSDLTTNTWRNPTKVEIISKNQIKVYSKSKIYGIHYNYRDGDFCTIKEEPCSQATPINFCNINNTTGVKYPVIGFADYRY